MRIGLVGMPGCGKTTVFNLLTGLRRELDGSATGRTEANIGVVKVMDERLDRLALVFESRKKVHAELVLVDVALPRRDERATDAGEELSRAASDVDGLVLVLGAFSSTPEQVTDGLDDTLLAIVLSDLAKVERRIERLQKDIQRGQKDHERELRLFARMREQLEAGRRINRDDIPEQDELLVRGFQFLSLKPTLALLNVADDDVHGERQEPVRAKAAALGLPLDAIAGRVELELTELPDDEREVFQAEYGISESARDRCVHSAYSMLHLVTFFTAAENEARAWPVPAGMTAAEAAAKIHTDMAKGFICAETVALEKLFQAGAFAECRAHGHVRLEGRDYVVRDGDMITFRFSR